MARRQAEMARFLNLLLSSDDRVRWFPWRESDDAYEVLVGEVLLQRTRAENVVSVYRDFLSRWPSPHKLARARLSTIERVIRPVGLPHRAKHLHHLGKALVRDGVPISQEELERLPGVGPYTSRAVTVFAYNEQSPLVDWVIARVLRRFFGLPQGRKPNYDKELWELASGLIECHPAKHVWVRVLDLAASTCKPRPLCRQCPLQSACSFSTS